VWPLVEALTDCDSDFIKLLLLHEFLLLMTKDTRYKSNQQYQITQDSNVCTDFSLPYQYVNGVKKLLCTFALLRFCFIQV
jgi:hypothetical protein